MLKLQFSLALFCFLGVNSQAAPRPKELTHKYKGNVYGILDPQSKLYRAEIEKVPYSDVEKTLDFLKKLKTNPWLREQCIKADPSLGALLDKKGFYPALATRYRYEPLLEGTIPEQEPPIWNVFAKYVRSQSQNSAMAKVIRNRFRYFEKFLATALKLEMDILPNKAVFTFANLGSASGDDVSGAVSRLTFGKGSPAIRQLLYDIDTDAMNLGVALGSKYFKYSVIAKGDVNLIDLNNLEGISSHLKSERVNWLHTSGFLMNYRIEKSPNLYYTHAEKESLFRAYCRGGVNMISFSVDHEHPLPRYIVNEGWKQFELDWSHDEILAMMKRAGYELMHIDTEELQWMKLYYFKGQCS